MPYVIPSPASLNPSASTPSIHIFTSISQLSRDHPLGKKLFSVLSPKAPRYTVQCSSATMARTPAVPTLKAVTSAVAKPLKSSLKRCISRGITSREAHVVSRNVAPSVSRKNVRFKEIDDQLESVCFFRATGRPSAIFSLNSDSDTESETASSDDDNDAAAAPPLLTHLRTSFEAMMPSKVADIVSPIPSPHTPLTCHTHVRLESLSLVTAGVGQGLDKGQGPGQLPSPLILRGIIRVRNIAYDKCVAARYTYDNWTTTIEVLARYMDPSHPALAPEPAITSGDGNGAWDWFTFTISLGLRGLRARCAALPRTLLLAVRFSVDGAGEWWDNNGGENFRIVLGQSHAGRNGDTVGGGHGKPPRPPV
jgi:Carbohydrate/starch-binding module (family 21)